MGPADRRRRSTATCWWSARRQSLDYHKGVIHDVTEEAVRFDLDGEMLPVKRSKVYGLVYRHGAEPELPAAVCRITDAVGFAMVGALAALADKLHWTTPAGLACRSRSTRSRRSIFPAARSSI